MSGLIDSQGLNFGTGLKMQEDIGGGGLTIVIVPAHANSYVTEGGIDPYVNETNTAFYVTE
jgi:hypothetical protein